MAFYGLSLIFLPRRIQNIQWSSAFIPVSSNRSDGGWAGASVLKKIPDLGLGSSPYKGCQPHPSRAQKAALPTKKMSSYVSNEATPVQAFTATAMRALRVD